MNYLQTGAFVCRTFVFRWSCPVVAEADAVPPEDAADLLAAQSALGEHFS